MNNWDKLQNIVAVAVVGLLIGITTIDAYNNNRMGDKAFQDSFMVVDEGVLAEGEVSDTRVLGETIEADMIYKMYEVDLPLIAEDYYYGKYINGRAGAIEINTMPSLRAGDRVGLFANNYVTLYGDKGYVTPAGYYRASGLCWSMSALGQLMDEANIEFQAKYGMPLFVFEPGDRGPHGHTYKTYEKSNRGYGYAVLKIRGGGQDYRFTINPNIQSIPELQDLKIKIVMTYTDKHGWASHGESIGGYILTNKPVLHKATPQFRAINPAYLDAGNMMLDVMQSIIGGK